VLFLRSSLSNENGGGLLAVRDRFEHRRSCFAKALALDVGGDIDRTNFSRLCKSFHSFRSIGLLSISEKLGATQPDLAITLQDLASVYENQANHADAEGLYRRAPAPKTKPPGYDTRAASGMD